MTTLEELAERYNRILEFQHKQLDYFSSIVERLNNLSEDLETLKVEVREKKRED